MTTTCPATAGTPAGGARPSGRTYERIEADALTGGRRRREFLAMNRNGRIPVVALEDGASLAGSNAILH